MANIAKMELVRLNVLPHKHYAVRSVSIFKKIEITAEPVAINAPWQVKYAKKVNVFAPNLKRSVMECASTQKQVLSIVEHVEINAPQKDNIAKMVNAPVQQVNYPVMVVVLIQISMINIVEHVEILAQKAQLVKMVYANLSVLELLKSIVMVLVLMSIIAINIVEIAIIHVVLAVHFAIMVSVFVPKMRLCAEMNASILTLIESIVELVIMPVLLVNFAQKDNVKVLVQPQQLIVIKIVSIFRRIIVIAENAVIFVQRQDNYVSSEHVNVPMDKMPVTTSVSILKAIICTAENADILVL